MSKGAKFAYLRHLEEQAEIKARERYWKKIFAQAHPPAKKSKKSKSKFFRFLIFKEKSIGSKKGRI